MDLLFVVLHFILAKNDLAWLVPTTRSIAASARLHGLIVPCFLVCGRCLVLKP